MDLSGIIFVVLAAVWAVYLIPRALRQHDEVARRRSVDRSSPNARVVARREPVSRRDARLVVNPGAADPGKEPASLRKSVEPGASSRRGEDRRTAGRVAARRRRRVLTVLLLLISATAAAAYLGHTPWWSAVVPGGLTLGFLLLCRTQVQQQRSRRHRSRAERPMNAASPTVEVEREAVLSISDDAAEAAGAAATEMSAAQQVQPNPDPVPAPVAEAAAHPTAQDVAGAERGPLWDPVPVTLPTYVTKPKAKRTVRTIDLGEAGTWTSGHTPEDAEIAARATELPAVTGQSSKAGQRAVGT
ncbi:MAG TPA: hypothetical protein VFQ11_00470 [Nocardioidaceae bacterium]|nr:hypothetical protein [Nocardioidaceae bacterium]